MFSQRPQLLPPAVAPLATAPAFGLWATSSVVGFGQGVPPGTIIRTRQDEGGSHDQKSTGNQLARSLGRGSCARCRSRARDGPGNRDRRVRRGGADHAAGRQLRRAGQPRSASGLRQLGRPDHRRHVHGPDHRGRRRHRDPRRRRELDDLRRRPDLHLHAARPYLVGRHAGHRRGLRVRPAPDPRSRDRGRIRLSALPDQERRGDQQRQPRPIPRRSARARSIPRPSRSRSSSRPPTSSSC